MWVSGSEANWGTRLAIFPADICPVGRAFVRFCHDNSYNEGMNTVLGIAGEIGSGSCVASGEILDQIFGPR